MKIFVKTRESIALRSIKRKKKNLIRNRKVNNFTNSKNIGIYFDTNNPEQFNAIWKFTKDLEKDGIKSQILGYVMAEEIPGEMSLRENCLIFLPKDLDWAYRPKIEVVSEFIQKEFDILFDFSLNDSTPGFFINTLSLAHFKVGRFRESYNDIDLMINTDKNNTVEFLIEQVINYVSILNKVDN